MNRSTLESRNPRLHVLLKIRSTSAAGHGSFNPQTQLKLSQIAFLIPPFHFSHVRSRKLADTSIRFATPKKTLSIKRSRPIFCINQYIYSYISVNYTYNHITHTYLYISFKKSIKISKLTVI